MLNHHIAPITNFNVRVNSKFNCIFISLYLLHLESIIFLDLIFKLTNYYVFNFLIDFCYITIL